MPELLENVNLSANTCPKCIDAAGTAPKTYAQWESSAWGLPGSSGRYCEGDCHCILFPIEMKDEFPEIGKLIKLRGDIGSGIPKIIEIGIGERELINLMDEWNDLYGVLPKELYTMTVEDALIFLKEAIKAKQKAML